VGYAAKQDMIDRFGETELVQISNKDAAGATSIDDPALEKALADASAEIDGYLAGRYTLPLANPPPVLKRNACDIARYHLYDDRVTEQVQKRYDSTIAYLRSVGKGDISLGLDSSNQETPASSGGPKADPGNDRVFTRNSLSDY